jgi:hypothetical protein
MERSIAPRTIPTVLVAFLTAAGIVVPVRYYAMAAGTIFPEDDVCIALFGGAPCTPELDGRAFGADVTLTVAEDVGQPGGASSPAYVDAKAASVTVVPHGQSGVDKEPFTVLRLNSADITRYPCLDLNCTQAAASNSSYTGPSEGDLLNVTNVSNHLLYHHPGEDVARELRDRLNGAGLHVTGVPTVVDVISAEVVHDGTQTATATTFKATVRFRFYRAL